MEQGNKSHESVFLKSCTEIHIRSSKNGQTHEADTEQTVSFVAVLAVHALVGRLNSAHVHTHSTQITQQSQ